MLSSSQTHLPARPKGPEKMQPWVHLAAGASGGITTCILTSPLDVLRTRLQSGLYQPPPRRPASGAPERLPLRLLTAPFRPIHETFQILLSIQKNESWRGLFRGLGPGLFGVVPATAIKFYVYGNCKQLGASYLGRQENDPLIHAQAAVAAGIATATATNPLWLVKTRLQLDQSQTNQGSAKRQHTRAFDCIRQVLREEGVAGLYKGLSASYLGTIETVLHLVLYERLKQAFRTPPAKHFQSRRPALEELKTWAGTSGAAGLAKLAAVLITYPHEVVRTRLRQSPMEKGQPAYTGLLQCFRLVWKQEGWRGLYGGLTPHLVRSIPSAVITFGVYEFVLRLASLNSMTMT